MEKLQARVEKQTQRKDDLTGVVTNLSAEVEQLEYERGQYTEKIEEVTAEADQLDNQVSSSTIQEHEIVVVSALIEEKARLAEAKTQLKKNCKDEKARLEEQLAKMQQRKE